jgi:hypothetical protein
VKESDRRVLRAAARALNTSEGNWPGADQIGQDMGGLDLEVVTDTLRALQRSGYVKLDGSFGGDASSPVFVKEITAKGCQVVEGR